MLAKNKLLLILTLLLVMSAVGIADGPGAPVYKVYAISYGRTADLEVMVWLLRSADGRNILVDCGFHRMAFMRSLFGDDFEIRDYIRPDKAVAKLGLRPEEISDVIITHVDFDHVGGLDLFPKAHVWVQKDELCYYTSEAWQPDGRHRGVDPEDMLTLVRLNTEGRVTLIDGDGKEPIEGIEVFTGGRHTYASQFLCVNTKSGPVVLASDNVTMYENLEKNTPISLTFDASSNLRAQERMKQMVSDQDLIIPGHDPAVFVKFSKPGNGIAKIEK